MINFPILEPDFFEEAINLGFIDEIDYQQHLLDEEELND